MNEKIPLILLNFEISKEEEKGKVSEEAKKNKLELMIEIYTGSKLSYSTLNHDTFY
jgi:hypothetical protein